MTPAMAEAGPDRPYRPPRVRSERLATSVLGATTYNCFDGTCCDKPCNPGKPCPAPHTC